MTRMDCTAARERMLEADPAELRGDGDGPLAGHLRACAACRARAGLILAGQAELDAALWALASPSPGRKVIPLRPRAGWRVRPGPAAASFAALAAAVAGVMLARPHPRPAPGVTADQIAKLLFPTPPVARAEGGRNVAVLETSDPGVTVVWVY